MKTAKEVVYTVDNKYVSCEASNAKWVLLWLIETLLLWNFSSGEFPHQSGEFLMLKNLIITLDILYASVKKHNGA